MEFIIRRQRDLIDVRLTSVPSFITVLNPCYVQSQSAVFQSLHEHPARDNEIDENRQIRSQKSVHCALSFVEEPNINAS